MSGFEQVLPYMLMGLVLSPDRSNTSSLSKGCGEALSLVSGPFPGREAAL